MYFFLVVISSRVLMSCCCCLIGFSASQATKCGPPSLLVAKSFELFLESTSVSIYVFTGAGDCYCVYFWVLEISQLWLVSVCVSLMQLSGWCCQTRTRLSRTTFGCERIYLVGERKIHGFKIHSRLIPHLFVSLRNYMCMIFTWCFCLTVFFVTLAVRYTVCFCWKSRGSVSFCVFVQQKHVQISRVFSVNLLSPRE